MPLLFWLVILPQAVLTGLVLFTVAAAWVRVFRPGPFSLKK